MNELPLMEKLNEKLDVRERIFYFSSIQLRKNKFVRVLLNISSADYDNIFDYSLRQKTEEILKGIIPADFEVEVDFRKAHTTETAVIMEVTDFLYKNYPSMFSALKANSPIVSYESGKITIILSLAGHLFVFLNESGAKEKLEEYLSIRFIEKSEVIFQQIEDGGEFILPNVSPVQSFSLPTVDIKTTKSLFGSMPRMPLYISEVLSRGEQEFASVCGKIFNFRTFYTREGNRPFYIFQLDDTTETITAKIFLPKKKPAKDELAAGSADSKNIEEFKSKRQLAAEELADGLEVVAEGRIVYDEREGKFSMLVNRLAFCEIDYSSIDIAPKYKELPSDYSSIRPKPFNETAQETVTESIDFSAFKGSKFVVLDVKVNESEIAYVEMLKFYEGRTTEILQADLLSPIDYYTPPHSFSKVIGDLYLFSARLDVYYEDSEALNKFLAEARLNLYDFPNNFINISLLAKKEFPETKYSMEKLCKHYGIEECLGERNAVVLGKLVRRLIGGKK